MKLPMDREGIMGVIPHRDPFLLIDEVLECEPGKRCVALKHVRGDEFWFPGHYPGNPVMPGVLIVEAIAQAGGVAMLTLADCAGKVPLFGGIKKARFRQVVRPGDTLRIEAELVKVRGPLGIGEGRAFVGDRLACECELTFAIIDRE